MLQFKPSKCSSFGQGFAPIWIILLVFLFGGIFVLGKGKLGGNTPVKTAPVSPTPSASSESTKNKQQSLYDLCQSEIQKLPKLPFEYEKITSTGSSAEQYRKDRIKDKKYMAEYAACGLNYSTINIIEKTYVSLGLQYYEYSKADKNLRWANNKSINQLPKNIDNLYGEMLKKEGWVRQTKEGGENLAYGLPTLIYYKEMGDKNYYIDVVVGPSPASLYLLIVKK